MPPYIIRDELNQYLLVFLIATVLSVLKPVQAANSLGENWTTIPGSAVDIAINGEDQTYALALDGVPWRWRHDKKRWQKMDGQFARIASAERNRPWSVNSRGIAYRFNGLWWEDKETNVVDVAADALGNVYIATNKGVVKQWNPLRGDWKTLGGGGTAKRLAVDNAGKLWVVTLSGGLASFDGKEWQQLAGRAIDIAASSDLLAIVDPNGDIAIKKISEQKWRRVSGISNAKAVAISSKNILWAITQQNQIAVNLPAAALANFMEKQSSAKNAEAPSINAWQLKAPSISSKSIVASIPKAPEVRPSDIKAKEANPSTIEIADSTAALNNETDYTSPTRSPTGLTRTPSELTSFADLSFTNTRRSISKLAIGKDGSVFGLDAFGNVKRWSNERLRFESFPGVLINIAVDADGNPWGVSALGRVFRHNGMEWKQIIGAVGSDIAIGGDGTVIITDAKGRLFEANPNLTRFSLIQGNGVKVAVDPDGIPWTINENDFVQRCDAFPCVTLPEKAKELAIGPDGTLFIISEQDLLLRKFANSDEFEPVFITGHAPVDVAAGPNGLPWIVSNSGDALAASFFERDESGDRAIANFDIGDTVGSGELGTVVTESTSGFTFTKRMRFEDVPNTIPVPSVGGASIATNSEGDIWILRSNAGDNELPEKFNPKSDRFDAISMTEFDNQGGWHNDFDVDSNNDLWYADRIGLRLIFNETPTQEFTYQFDGGFDMPARISISPDDTVYATVIENGTDYVIYKKAVNERDFKKFSRDKDIGDIAAGPGNDLWVIELGTNLVQQWNGQRFVNQPARRQTAKNIDIGSNGTIYIVDQSDRLRKWNASSKRFDLIRNVTASQVAVDNDGRPWVVDNSSPGVEIKVERAKD